MTTPSPAPQGDGRDEPITIWAAHCPFRRAGSPVLGNMGATVREVIVIETREWERLVAQHPTLQTAQFRVGTFQ